jgi:single-strand DNA-binding protein
MASYDRVVIMGNLTGDPDIKYTQEGKAICNFNMATNRTWKDATGKKNEEVCFFSCASFGKTAETICQYFKKGDPILIEGRHKFDTWIDKVTGQKRNALKIVVETFKFCGKTSNTKSVSGEAEKPSVESDLEGFESEEGVPF